MSKAPACCPPASCPALLVAAPASGQGKTTVTAALARLHRRAGRRVRVFKCGPDFLDPMVLEAASGAPVHQLDLFMLGEVRCRALLHEAACEADLILVEGVMGLFDGDPSAADLAARFDLPVLAVIDGSAMAQTFGAIVKGLDSYRSDVSVGAVLANRVGSERHAAMLEGSVPGAIRWLGALPRSEEASLPERHLGIMQAGEIGDLDTRLDLLADLLPEAALRLPEPVAFPAPPPRASVGPLLEGKTVAIARDAALGFIYPANLEMLEAMGARLASFSPLADDPVPPCDALWLPGGYPELHLERLSTNAHFIASLRTLHAAGKPILAECGGMLLCCEMLTDAQGKSAAMAGILPGNAHMRRRLAALGMQEVICEEESLRGHTFHYAELATALEPAIRASYPDYRPGEAIYRHGSLVASFLHAYFPSAPLASLRLLGLDGSSLEAPAKRVSAEV